MSLGVMEKMAQVEEWVDVDLRDRRAELTLQFTRYVAWGALGTIILLFVAWVFSTDSNQLLIALGLMLPLVTSSWAFPWFYRQGKMVVGTYFFLASLLFVLVFSLLMLPEVTPATVIGFAVFIITSYLLVGVKGSQWLVGSSIVALGIDIALLHTLTFDRPELNTMLVLILNVGCCVTAALVVAATVRQIVLDQEDYFRQFKQITRQIEDRAVDEQKQREYLQSTVEEYARYMSLVGQGDLVTKLAVGEGRHTEDDSLLVLGHRLNEMSDNLQHMILQVRETAQSLSATAAGILSSTTQQAGGATEQSAAIAQTTTTVDELKTIAEQSVTRAQEVAGASQRTVEVSRSGRQAVQETIGSMGQIKVRVEGIAENILALSEQTQQIGEIITTVNDISAQSNILALNASVEAARAGEYGKGFAVVAVEVRNLAEQSRQATAQVKAILSDIQKATNATVMATEEGTKRVDEGVQLAAQAQAAIEQLASVIDESAQAATQMVAGGRQQSAGVEQVAVAMQSINQATVQSLASTRQAEKAARDLNELALSLTDIVAQYHL
ncbi:MAG: methyl-accepting chemotaxis protein [Chloroflexi bacterium]|nr:methyl-accepting chemotaxis protein [Chloroflexota bacterium]